MIGLSELQRDVETVIKYSQAYPFDLNCKPLLDDWLANKSDFISVLDGLIYRSPSKITVTLSDSERSKSFASFINSLTENGIFAKSRPIGELSLLDFLYDNKDGFLLNRTIKDYPELHINRNQKLLKTVSKFFSDESTARWVQDTASTFIQTNKIEGYLYFSVHPLDYLLMSETNLGWRSCHALDGDYRYGNLSYMVDNTTMVVYLADEEQVHLKCLPSDMKWYNKKWRMLVHTNGEKVIYYGKGYPFQSSELLSKVYEQLFKWFRIANFGRPMAVGFNRALASDDTVIPLHRNYMTLGNQVVPAKELIDYSEYYGFPDLIDSVTYAPIVSLHRQTSYNDLDDLKIKIGKKAPCPCCGKVAFWEPRRELLVCADCEDKYKLHQQYYPECRCCGRRIYDDEIAYELTDTHQIYCKKCYNSLDKGERKYGKAWGPGERSRYKHH